MPEKELHYLRKENLKMKQPVTVDENFGCHGLLILMI